MANIGVHLSHCNIGEYADTCKYGEQDDCPALPWNHMSPEDKALGRLMVSSPDPKVRNKCAIDFLDRKIYAAVHYLEQAILDHTNNSGTLIWVIGELGQKMNFDLIDPILRKGSWEAKQMLAALIQEDKIKLSTESFDF